MARIGIGVPVYNGETFVEAAIRSLLAQSYDDFEIFVSDNASTDRTEEICRALANDDPRVRYQRNETNLGAARNFNLTFERSRGEYFKWAAADDLCESRFLERCVEVMDADPGIVLCHTQVEEIDSGGERRHAYDFPMRTDAGEPHLRFGDLVVEPHPATAVFGLIRRDILARTGLIGPFVSSDRALLAELALYGRFHEITEPLFLRRIHSGNSILLGKRSTLLSWYDPSKQGRIYFPHWRLAVEYVRAARRAPLDTADRWRCLGAVARFVKSRGSEFTVDVAEGCRRYAAQSASAKRLAGLLGLRRKAKSTQAAGSAH